MHYFFDDRILEEYGHISIWLEEGWLKQSWQKVKQQILSSESKEQGAIFKTQEQQLWILPSSHVWGRR